MKIGLVFILLVVAVINGYGQDRFDKPHFEYIYENLPSIDNIVTDNDGEVIGKAITDRKSKIDLANCTQTQLSNGLYKTVLNFRSQVSPPHYGNPPFFDVFEDIDLHLTFDKPVISAKYTLVGTPDNLTDSINNKHTTYHVKANKLVTEMGRRLGIVIISKTPVVIFLDRVCNNDLSNTEIVDIDNQQVGKLIIDTASKIVFNDIVNVRKQIKEPDGLYKTTFELDVFTGRAPFYISEKTSDVNIGFRFNGPVLEAHYISRTRSNNPLSGGTSADHITETMLGNKTYYHLKLDGVGNSNYTIVITSKTPVYTVISSVLGRGISYMTN
jgi:hypothetical protein